MKIPFLNFSGMHNAIETEMVEAFKVFYRRQWYVLGRDLSSFEEEYAQFSNTKYCVGVSNGLDALYLCLKALGIKEGDEVIVPSNTYIATLLAITYCNAKPILVEPDANTYNIDPVGIRNAISKNTKAILPVHLYGQSCNMSEIMAIASEFNLFVIEDNAQSHGATWEGKITGSWGHCNATSFYPGKNLGALGDAGAITTDNFELYEIIKTLRNYGSKKKYYNEMIGHNMRLDELQAAFLRIKLHKLNEWTEQRIEIAKQYFEYLSGVGDIIVPAIEKSSSHVFHLFVIRTKKREALIKHLADQEIGTLIHYPVPPHLQQAYKSLNFSKGDFPIAEELSDTCLSLPLWPGMTNDQISFVSDSIRKFFN